MTRCLLWGLNSLLFAALSAHPLLPAGWSIAAGAVAVAAWLRGFQVARHG